MDKIKKQALINSGLTLLYVIAIGVFFYYGAMIKIGKANSFLAPIAFLLLFVFSAALTGYLLVGKPAQMYVDGKKKEALSLITYTLVFLFGFTLIALTLLVILAR